MTSSKSKRISNIENLFFFCVSIFLLVKLLIWIVKNTQYSTFLMIVVVVISFTLGVFSMFILLYLFRILSTVIERRELQLREYYQRFKSYITPSGIMFKEGYSTKTLGLYIKTDKKPVSKIRKIILKIKSFFLRIISGIKLFIKFIKSNLNTIEFIFFCLFIIFIIEVSIVKIYPLIKEDNKIYPIFFPGLMGVLYPLFKRLFDILRR